MSGELPAERREYTFVAGEAGILSLQLRDALGNARSPSGEHFVATLERRSPTGATGGGAAGAAAALAPATADSADSEIASRADSDQSSLGLRADPEERHAASLADAVREATAAPRTTDYHPLATPKVSTSEDGQRLRVTFTATRAEQLLLHVAMRSAISGTDGSEEVPLRGSPYTVDIVPGATLPRRCESYGEATHRARVRQPTSFILVARDAHGNRRTHGGDHFLVSFRGPCNPIGRVYDRGDGTYRVTCTYGVSGHCSLAITLHQQHVAGSPFRIIVDGPLRPPQAHPTHASMAPPTADNDQSGPQKRRAPPTAPGSTATAGGSGAAPRAVVVHDIRGRGAGGGSRPLSPRGAPVTVNSAVRVALC
jgi:hypothetical protein